jgi:thiol peroxidase
MERMNAMTFGRKPVTLVGPELKAGDIAPDATLVAGDLSEVKLSSFAGKPQLISVVTSLDTGICDEQTRRFDLELAKMPGLQVITVSCDLPFAQGRFCASANVGHAVLSDHRDVSFGRAYGVLIKEVRLLARTLFVIGRDGRIAYVQRVSENGTHPDYEAALAAAKKVI